MSNTEFSDKPASGQLSFVTAFLKGYLTGNKRRHRRMADTLMLNDHTLKDIGLQRADITSGAPASWARRGG